MDYKKFKKDCIEYYIQKCQELREKYNLDYQENKKEFDNLNKSEIDNLRDRYLNKKIDSVLRYANYHINKHKSGEWKGATVNSPFIKVQISGIAERNEKIRFFVNYFNN